MKIIKNRIVEFNKIKKIAYTIIKSTDLLDIRDLENEVRKMAYEHKINYKKLLMLALSIEKLKRKFPNKSSSWILRAAIRVIIGILPLSSNAWKVPGLMELNDYYSWYYVRFDNAVSVYKCDCYYHAWGFYRKYKVCTHVAAVLVFKEMNRLMSEYLRGDIFE